MMDPIQEWNSWFDSTPYVGCCCRVDPDGVKATHSNSRHLKGGLTCVESRFYSVRRHCSPAWPWRQRLRHRSLSALAFSRFASMATTTMRPMPARPMAITGQGTSTTASSWAWAHGPVGATATAGAAIGSPGMAAEAITAVAARQPIAAILHAVVAAQIATTRQAERVPAPVMHKRCAPVPQLPMARPHAQQHRARRLRTQHQPHTQRLAAVVVDIKAVAASRTVVAAADMKVATADGTKL